MVALFRPQPIEVHPRRNAGTRIARTVPIHPIPTLLMHPTRQRPHHTTIRIEDLQRDLLIARELEGDRRHRTEGIRRVLLVRPENSITL